MRGGVHGACGMHTTTPPKKNEKNKTEQSKNRDRPIRFYIHSFFHKNRRFFISTKIEDFFLIIQGFMLKFDSILLNIQDF